LGSITVTVTGLYFMPSGSKKTGAHGGSEHKHEEVSEASEAPKAEESREAPTEETSSESPKEEASSDAPKGEEATEAPKAEEGEKTSQPSSQAGQEVPPTPSDSTSLAENTVEKKEQHKNKDTVCASASFHLHYSFGLNSDTHMNK
jgi:hypothetical protein